MPAILSAVASARDKVEAILELVDAIEQQVDVARPWHSQIPGLESAIRYSASAGIRNDLVDTLRMCAAALDESRNVVRDLAARTMAWYATLSKPQQSSLEWELRDHLYIARREYSWDADARLPIEQVLDEYLQESWRMSNDAAQAIVRLERRP